MVLRFPLISCDEVEPAVHTDFRPLPLLGNNHLQTVLANLFQGPSLRQASTPRIVDLPDGDQLVAHDTVPEGWQPGEPVAVLLHGLGGTHRSGYLTRLARMLLPRGYRVIRLDLRGTGLGLPLARRPYHAGCSSDLRVVMKQIDRWCPGSPVVTIGFSLGGNIALKLAGEAATKPVPNLDRVVAISAPIDVGRCAAMLGEPRNRLYEMHFLRELVAREKKRHRFIPDLPPMELPRRGLTMRIFDDRYTAVRCGFADALDYYHRSASLPLIQHIQVPTLMLTARDDPFIAVEPYEKLEAPMHVDVRISKHGGHLGYLGWDGAGGIRWAERRVVEWLEKA